MHPFSLNDEALDQVAGGQIPAGTPPLDTTPVVITVKAGEDAGTPPYDTTLRIGEEGGGGEYEV